MKLKDIIPNLLDVYFRRPVFCDAIFITIFWIISLYFSLLLKKINVPLIIAFDKPSSLSYLSNLVSTDITLAGFIVAALTILITVKSSVTAKGYRDANNAMEYLFSTKNYTYIVDVFIKSIIELFIIFIALYVGWLFSGNLNEKLIYRILIFSTFGIIISTGRVLYALFAVLRLENLPKL